MPTSIAPLPTSRTFSTSATTAPVGTPPSVDPPADLPTAHLVRLEMASALAENRHPHIDALVTMMMRDGSITQKDLIDAETALLAEVASGNITRAIAQHLIGKIVGRIDERVALGTAQVAEDLRTMASKLGDLQLDDARFDRFALNARHCEEARSVRRTLGQALRDGVLSESELAEVVQRASTTSGTSGLTLIDVRVMYDAVEKRFRDGHIDRGTYEALLAQIDDALTKKVEEDGSVDERVREYVISGSASRALDPQLQTGADWKAAIDIMVFDADKGAHRRLRSADLVALTDRLFSDTRSPTDAQVQAFAEGLAQAHDAKLITDADYKAAAQHINLRVQRARYGLRDVPPLNLVPETPSTAGVAVSVPGPTPTSRSATPIHTIGGVTRPVVAPVSPSTSRLLDLLRVPSLDS